MKEEFVDAERQAFEQWRKDVIPTLQYVIPHLLTLDVGKPVQRELMSHNHAVIELRVILNRFGIVQEEESNG